MKKRPATSTGVVRVRDKKRSIGKAGNISHQGDSRSAESGRTGGDNSVSRSSSRFFITEGKDVNNDSMYSINAKRPMTSLSSNNHYHLRNINSRTNASLRPLLSPSECLSHIVGLDSRSHIDIPYDDVSSVNDSLESEEGKIDVMSSLVDYSIQQETNDGNDFGTKEGMDIFENERKNEIERPLSNLSCVTKNVNTMLSAWMEHADPSPTVVTGNKAQQRIPDQSAKKRDTNGMRKKSIEQEFEDIQQLIKIFKNQNDDSILLRRQTTETQEPGSSKFNSSQNQRKISNFSVSNSRSRKSPRRLLDQKILELGGNSWKLEEFKRRIQEYKKEETSKRKSLSGGGNFVRRGIERADDGKYSRETFIKEKQLTLKTKREREERVKQNRISMDKQKLEKLNENVKRKVEITNTAEIQRNVLHYSKRSSVQYKVFSPIAYILRFFGHVFHQLEAQKRSKYDLAKHIRSIQTIRKFIIPIIYKKRREKIRESIGILKKNMLIFVLGLRITQKRKAIDMIKRSIIERGNKSKVQNQVSYFLSRVRKCQIHVRRHLMIRKAQRKLLTLQWLSVEKKVVREQKQADLEELRKKVLSEIENLYEGTRNVNPHKNNSLKQNMQKTNHSTMECKRLLKRILEVLLSNKRAVKRGEEYETAHSMLSSKQVPHNILVKAGVELQVYAKNRITTTRRDIREKLLEENFRGRLTDHLVLKMRRKRMEEQRKQQRRASRKMTGYIPKLVSATSSENLLASSTESNTDHLDNAKSEVWSDNVLQKGNVRFRAMIPEAALRELIKKGLSLTLKELIEEESRMKNFSRGDSFV